MTVLTVPQDPEAEATVAGCAIATRRGARLAARVPADAFYDGRLRNLFEAAVALDVADLDGRVTAVATRCGRSPRGVWRTVDDRPVMFDETGSYAARVVDAARRRTAMGAALAAFNALGEGGTLADVAPLLAGALQ